MVSRRGQVGLVGLGAGGGGILLALSNGAAPDVAAGSGALAILAVLEPAFSEMLSIAGERIPAAGYGADGAALQPVLEALPPWLLELVGPLIFVIAVLTLVSRAQSEE